MNLEFYIYIAISAGTGTAIVEIIINTLLNHILKRKYHEFVINKKTKTECAEEILDLINPRNTEEWRDFSSDIYNRAYLISDRLITLGEEKNSKKLDNYVSLQRFSNDLLEKLFAYSAQNEEVQNDFIETLGKIDTIRLELVKICAKLRK